MFGTGDEDVRFPVKVVVVLIATTLLTFLQAVGGNVRM
jgi:hypothetical protein